MPTRPSERQKFFSYYYGYKIFWLRILGFGFSIESIHRNYLPFSYRYGHRKGWKLFDRYYFEVLKPNSHL